MQSLAKVVLKQRSHLVTVAHCPRLLSEVLQEDKSRQYVEAAVPARVMPVALFGVAEEFVREDHLGGIPPFMEFDRDQRFILLLVLSTTGSFICGAESLSHLRRMLWT